MQHHLIGPDLPRHAGQDLNKNLIGDKYALRYMHGIETDVVHDLWKFTRLTPLEEGSGLCIQGRALSWSKASRVGGSGP